MTESNWLTTALAEIKNIETEYGKENWDGFGAAPISKETIGYASEFVRLLYRLQAKDDLGPTIGPEEDGTICLLWELSEWHSLVIDISGSGFVNFAWGYGATISIHGRLPIDPPNIEKSVMTIITIIDSIF